MKFGEHIKAIRKREGYTIVTIAKICGVCEKHYRRYESGEILPNKKNLIDKICKGLKINEIMELGLIRQILREEDDSIGLFYAEFCEKQIRELENVYQQFMKQADDLIEKLENELDV